SDPRRVSTEADGQAPKNDADQALPPDRESGIRRAPRRLRVRIAAAASHCCSRSSGGRTRASGERAARASAGIREARRGSASHRRAQPPTLDTPLGAREVHANPRPLLEVTDRNERPSLGVALAGSAE